MSEAFVVLGFVLIVDKEVIGCGADGRLFCDISSDTKRERGSVLKLG